MSIINGMRNDAAALYACGAGASCDAPFLCDKNATFAP
jgi:hypothetical protein